MNLKKFFSGIMAGVMALTLVPSLTASAATFQDVNTGMWSYEYVESGVQKGFFDTGVYFRPHDNVNRAEMAKLAVMVAQYKGIISGIDHAGVNLPLDVPADSWFAPYVGTGIKYGFFEGYKDTEGNLTGYFGPGDNVTRSQATKILVEAAGIPETLTPAGNFSDVNSGDWFYGYVTTAYNQSLLDGYKDAQGNVTGKFGPNDPITREQMAKVLVNSLNPVLRDVDDDDDDDDDTDRPTSDGVLDVSLSSETPSTRNIPKDSTVTFLAVDFTASGDSVNLYGLTSTVTGLGDTEALQSFAWYEGNTRISAQRDFGRNLDRTFNFSTPVQISAGQTKTLYFKGKAMEDGNYYTMQVKARADVDSNAKSVTGSFAINGNEQRVANVAVATITAQNVIQDQGAVAQVGDDDVLLAEFDLDNDNREDVVVYGMDLYNGGTNNPDIVRNAVLYCDGDELSAGKILDRYVSFSINDGLLIERNRDVNCEVRADIASGDAGDNVELYFRETTDLIAEGMNYGFGVNFDNGNLRRKGDGIKVTLEAGDMTIAFDRSAEGVPAQDVKQKVNGQLIAILEIEAKAEQVTIFEIDKDKFYIEGAVAFKADDIQDVRMREIGGGTYDLDMNRDGNKIELGLRENIYFAAGEKKVFEIYADLDFAATGNTFKVVLKADGIDAENEANGNVPNITPNEAVSAVQTVAGARATFTTRKLTNFSAVEGVEGVKIFKASVRANRVSDIELREVKISTDGVGFTSNNITEVKAFLNGKAVGSASSISGNSVTIRNINTFIPAGETHTLSVEASFSSSFINPGDNFTTFVANRADVRLRDDDRNNVELEVGDFVGTDAKPSRYIALLESGSFKIVLENDVTDVADIYVIGGKRNLDRAIARLDVTTENENILWEEVTLERSAGDATGDDIVEICLYNDEWTAVACTMTEINDSSAVFEDMGITLEKNTVNEFYVLVEAEGINTGGSAWGAESDRRAQYKMTHAKGRGVSSGIDILLTGAGKAAVAMGDFDHESATREARVVAVAPTHVEALALPTYTLTGGTNTVARLRIHPDNADNRDGANRDAELKLTTLNIDFDDETTEIGGVRAYWASDSGNRVVGNVKDADPDNKVLEFDAAALAPLKGIKSADTLVVEITGVVVIVDISYFESDIDVNTGNIVFNDSYENFGGLRLIDHNINFGTLSN